jgi:hypothetical protein
MQSKYTSKEIARFWGKVQKTDSPNDCWEWRAGCFQNGYGCIKIDNVSKGAHRIAYEITFGKISSNLYICHKCDNKKCCNPNHLFQATHQENMNDMYRKGRDNHLRGDKNPKHKITDAQVGEIRKRYAPHGRGGESGRKLAKVFGVSFQLISQIIHGKNRQ